MGTEGAREAGQGRGAGGATEGQLYLPQVSGLLKPLLHCFITPWSQWTEATCQFCLVSDKLLRLGGDLAE